MPAAYKLTLDGTDYTHESGVVIDLAVDERRERHAITTLNAELADPEWWDRASIFGKLKDPAFSNVPVKLYLAKAGESRNDLVLVFDGKVTSLQPGYPGPKSLKIVAHDKSIDARRQKTFKAIKQKTSVQVCKTIAQAYGYEVDTSQVTEIVARLTTREIDILINPYLSDWDHIQRALAADGLVASMRKGKLHITQAPSVRYPLRFERGRYPVCALNVSINHVRGPGGQADTVSTAWMDQRGKVRAVQGSAAKEADKEKAQARTHRRPVAGSASESVAHAEDMEGNRPRQTVEYLRKRKDTAQLTLLPTPDLSVLNNVELAGWGAKVDGTWFVESVRHTIASNGGALTIASLMRGASPGAKKGAAL